MEPAAVGALLSITTGTLYQKRHVALGDVRTANGTGRALLVTSPWLCWSPSRCTGTPS
ncbi:MAG: hypothetical protein U1F00_23340 [Rhodoferax sp.]